jgi:hypothetical protein
VKSLAIIYQALSFEGPCVVQKHGSTTKERSDEIAERLGVHGSKSHVEICCLRISIGKIKVWLKENWIAAVQTMGEKKPLHRGTQLTGSLESP